jgi:hypothetical protein
MIPSALCLLVRLLGTITTQTFIAAQFSTDRRFVYFQAFGYFSLIMFHFQ